jgi:flagellar export protein FliJ
VKSFRFPLQRVLDWRGLQLRTEEERLAGLQQKLTSLALREKLLAAAQSKSESELLEAQVIAGFDLRALAGFQVRIKSERAALRASRAQCEANIAEQRRRLLKARKDCRVLEQLKEKRHREWTYLGDREVEETAAESYISSWLRSNAEG